MKVALFVPCYVDAVFPEVGIATLELLERFGVEVAFPLNQTCCGQPMANSGCHDDAAAAEALFVKNFAGFDRVGCRMGHGQDRAEQRRERKLRRLRRP
jgi:L-lactate dehydrogenase complex protein LldE